MKPVLFYCDHHPIPLPADHKFPIRKYRLLRERLEAEARFEFAPAPLADPAVIRLAHDPGYVDAFLNGTLDAAAVRRIGFPWSPELVTRTLASVGGTLAAAERAFTGAGWGGTLAGGTHHAFHGEGSGYCIFNDIAIAIHVLRAQGRIRRAAVIDLDVHQGDGTAKLFEHDPEALTLSFHGRNNFPFRKQRSKIDVEFEDGTEDPAYLAKLEEILPLVRAFEPDLVFYQSGVDALAADRLGRLALTHDGLRGRDALVLEAARGLPLVITLGGGYGDPIEATVEAHAATFLLAADSRVGG